MSINIKKLIYLLVILFTELCFSQQDLQKKEIIIFFEQGDKRINNINFNKDSTQTTFSIYTMGYESKKARDRAIKKYNDQLDDPNSAGIPDFSVSFISFSKPEKLSTIKGINYLELEAYRKQLFPQGYPMYFICKLKKGYLKWKVTHIEY